VPEHYFIDCSKSIVLDCRHCGEKLILLGEEADWRSRNAIFRCHCGEKLTLDDRIDEEALKIKEFVRNLGTAYG
jgi:hypothetical protein